MARQVVAAASRSTVVNFTLPLELLVRMDEFAAQAGVSRSRFLRGLIEEAIELDEVDMALAEEARERMNDPKREVVPYEQARAELGL